MTLKILSLFLIVCLFGQIQDSWADSGDEAKHIEKIKGSLKKIGRYSEVKIRLRDDIRLSGYVSEMGYDSFLLTSQVTKNDRWVRYENVHSVKGPGLHTSTKVLIGAVIGVATVITTLAILLRGY